MVALIAHDVRSDFLPFVITLVDVVVSAVARRGRAAAAVVSYSLPRLVTTVGGAAVEVERVGVFATALAVVFAFFGGMFTVSYTDARLRLRCNGRGSQRMSQKMSRREIGIGPGACRGMFAIQGP